MTHFDEYIFEMDRKHQLVDAFLFSIVEFWKKLGILGKSYCFMEEILASVNG